jgi:tagaturonate epimerase
LKETFPFALPTLRGHFPAIIPSSFVISDGAGFWVQQDADQKRFAVLAPSDHAVFSAFDGELGAFQSDYNLKLCLLTPPNAKALRDTLAWLAPKRLRLSTSAGFGDRLGLATPGHIRALRSVGGNIAPIFAQQSIREMERTNRSAQTVLDDATWGAFESGWKGTVGADADHLKTPEDIDVCVEAGYTFYTIDPGAYVDSSVEQADGSIIRKKVDALHWDNLSSSPGVLEETYVGKTIKLETLNVDLDKPSILKAAAKYGRAVAHVVAMYRHLMAKDIPFELEVSVDETETPTSAVEHIYIASELKRLHVEWVSLAPRYIGRFEKGVDYIGDAAQFEKDFAVHAEIARHFGPYKLSLHSGSDKFSIYDAAMRQSRGLVHLKTAGTSYLEALRTIAALDPKLFREIYIFARERYEIDRATYHVSASLDRAPAPETLSDSALPGLLNQFDARQILHVTYGSVLGARENSGRLRFYPDLTSLLHANSDVYATNLEKHFVQHLKPFASQ